MSNSAESYKGFRYPAPPRYLSMKNPSFLPDISEHSPPARPFSRSPSPPRQSARSVSVASFLSDGTIEIEGFGFDDASDAGDGESLYGDSMYEGSVYDGEEEEEGGSGRTTPTMLTRKAERVLANAKKKLDLCGQNILRARTSLIISPTSSPSTLLEHLEAVSPRQQPALHSRRMRYDRPTSHFRASSESAVPSRGAVNGISGPRPGDLVGSINNILEEHPLEIERPQSEMAKSTERMRALRDQMKDLRGKITNLQQQMKSDSMKRRSLNSLRSTPNPYESPTPTPTPTMEDYHRQQIYSSMSGEEWIEVDEIRDSDSSRSGTPKPYRPSVTSPFDERHENRGDAFSYESVIYGNGVYIDYSNHSCRKREGGSRSMSMGSATSSISTATVLEDPTRRIEHPDLKRMESLASIASYTTAAEEYISSDSRSSSSSSQNTYSATPQQLSNNSHNYNHNNHNNNSSSASNPPTAAEEWLSSNRSSPRDDGYHSAPHTPKNVYADPTSTPPTPSLESNTSASSSPFHPSLASPRKYPPSSSAVPLPPPGTRHTAWSIFTRR